MFPKFFNIPSPCEGVSFPINIKLWKILKPQSVHSGQPGAGLDGKQSGSSQAREPEGCSCRLPHRLLLFYLPLGTEREKAKKTWTLTNWMTAFLCPSSLQPPFFLSRCLGSCRSLTAPRSRAQSDSSVSSHSHVVSLHPNSTRSVLIDIAQHW